MARMRIGNAEVWGQVASSSLGIGKRTYDVYTRYLLAGDIADPWETPKLIGKVYRAAGGAQVVSHWRNTRCNTGYRTKWAAMLELYQAWLDGRDTFDAFYAESTSVD
jgi:hypothetical protein